VGRLGAGARPLLLGEKDPKYVDLVSMTDSFKDKSRGETRRDGRGQVRPGKLDLSRSSDCGVNCRPETDGAYQLLANLIGLRRPGRPNRLPAGRRHKSNFAARIVAHALVRAASRSSRGLCALRTPCVGMSATRARTSACATSTAWKMRSYSWATLRSQARPAGR